MTFADITRALVEDPEYRQELTRQVAAQCGTKHKEVALEGSAATQRIDEVLRAMVRRFAEVRPRASTAAAAVRGWSDDWSKVVDARERYATDLETKKAAQFVLPATRGVKPVTKNMDDFVRENHPNLDACFTEGLALETVEGPRDYKKVTQ